MLKQKAAYVDDVMSKIIAPDEFKVHLRNELLNYIETYGDAGINEIINKLGSPEKLADKILNKLVYGMNKELDGIFTEDGHPDLLPGNKYEGYDSIKHYDRHGPVRPYGEYTRTDSDINIKLLYIPLIQISSGVQTIHYILTDDDCHQNWPKAF